MQRGPSRAGVQAASIADLATAVRDRSPALDETRMVLIDGPAGSGKTTLARRLGRALAGGRPADPPHEAPCTSAAATGSTLVQTLHADDMYEGWSGLPILGDVLVTQVIEPLARGEAGRFRRWDWHRGGRADEIVVRPGGILVVEGVGVGMRAARAYASLVVWIEASPAVRLRRGIERDGEALRHEWEHWQRIEADVLARERTRHDADVRLDGERTLPD